MRIIGVQSKRMHWCTVLCICIWLFDLTLSHVQTTQVLNHVEASTKEWMAANWSRQMLGIFDDKDPPKQAPFANDTCPTMLTPQKKWAVEAFVGPQKCACQSFPFPFQNPARPSKESNRGRLIQKIPILIAYHALMM